MFPSKDRAKCCVEQPRRVLDIRARRSNYASRNYVIVRAFP